MVGRGRGEGRGGGKGDGARSPSPSSSRDTPCSGEANVVTPGDVAVFGLELAIRTMRVGYTFTTLNLNLTFKALNPKS